MAISRSKVTDALNSSLAGSESVLDVVRLRDCRDSEEFKRTKPRTKAELEARRTELRADLAGAPRGSSERMVIQTALRTINMMLKEGLYGPVTEVTA